MRNYAGTCKDICRYNLAHNFLIQLLLLKSLIFVVHFSNAFCHGNEAFLKGSPQNEIVLLLTIFHLPHSKYRGAKMCFYSCCYQNQNSCVCVALMLHSRRQYSTHVALVSNLCRFRHTCFTDASHTRKSVTDLRSLALCLFFSFECFTTFRI